MDKRYQLPTELAAEIIASNVAGKNVPGVDLVRDYVLLFEMIVECRKTENEARGNMIL